MRHFRKSHIWYNFFYVLLKNILTLVYRTLIEISLPPLPLPLHNSSHYHPWILAIVFPNGFPPSNSILDRVSILKYNHHNTAENPSTTFHCFGKRMQTTQCDLHKIQHTLAPLISFLCSLSHIWRILHWNVSRSFSQSLTPVPGITLSHLLIRTCFSCLSLHYFYPEAFLFPSWVWCFSFVHLEAPSFLLSERFLEYSNSFLTAYPIIP